MREGEVNVSKSATKVRLGERTVCFDNRNPSTMSWFIRFLIEERDRNRKTVPMYVKSLKVLSNSVYGSLGYAQRAPLLSQLWGVTALCFPESSL